MVKRKIKKKTVVKKQYERGVKLTPEQYYKLISKFKESSEQKEEKLFKKHLKKGTDPKLYAIQQAAETGRQKLIAESLKKGLERREAEVVRKQVAWEAKTPLQRGFSKLSPGARRLDTKVGAVVRKAIHLAAPRGFVKEITRQSGKGTGRGRGRPKKSYKLRFVPGIGAVRVPTHIYNKMMAEVKAKRRLAQAQKQAMIQQQQAARYEAEQIAAQTDPRFQSKDAFLEAPDMEHEQEVMQAKQQIMMEEQLQEQRERQIPQRGMVQRAGDVMRRAGAGLARFGHPRYPQQQYPSEMAQYPPQQVRGEPRVTTISDRSSLLNVPNVFNRPENVTVGFKRRG